MTSKILLRLTKPRARAALTLLPARAYVTGSSDSTSTGSVPESAVVLNPGVGFKASSSKLKMSGWQIHGYGDLSELQFSDKMRIPKILNSNDCLVKVNATGVNPIDVAMLSGYGAQVLNLIRCKPDIEFPLTLGREFCGELVQRGMIGKCESDRVEIGERVWGVVPVQSQGAHAEYIVVPAHCISAAPQSLTNEEAAAVLYAGLTAWSGLYITGGLAGISGALNTSSVGNSAIHKRVLVLGGSGSVGSLAIQMLKAEGAEVLATCSEDAKKMVKANGANVVVDYNSPNEIEELHNFAPYDIVLDCAGQGAPYANSLDFKFSQYITFSSPLLRNIDEAGLAVGLLKNAFQLLESNATALSSQKGLIKWGFFTPASQGIKFLSQLVNRKKLLPNIDSVYKFDDLPKAYEHVQKGHLRGKVVISIP